MKVIDIQEKISSAQEQIGYGWGGEAIGRGWPDLKRRGLAFVVSSLLAIEDHDQERSPPAYPFRVLNWAKECLPDEFAHCISVLRQENNELWWDEITNPQRNPAREREPVIGNGLLVQAFEDFFTGSVQPTQHQHVAAIQIVEKLKEVEIWQRDIDARFTLPDVDMDQANSLAKSSPDLMVDVGGMRVETKRLYYYVGFPPTERGLYSIRKIGTWKKRDKRWKVPRSPKTAKLLMELKAIVVKEGDEYQENLALSLLSKAREEEAAKPLVGQHGDIKVTLEGDHYLVKFTYRKDRVWAIKEIPGRRYLGKARPLWQIPIESRSAVEHFIDEYKGPRLR